MNKRLPSYTHIAPCAVPSPDFLLWLRARLGEINECQILRSLAHPFVKKATIARVESYRW